MTTDSRSNEPTETQVKLAYLAHLKAPRTRGMDVYGPMRAALVAAQGAAPQEPGRIMLRHPDGTAKTNDEIRAESAAGVAPRRDDLVERIADTLAYYQCRETNPEGG